jgi:hypothetical protein
MSQFPGFRYNAQGDVGSIKLPSSGHQPLVPAHSKNLKRTKIWELSTNLHCSIIGTCLTGVELRQFLHKMGETDAKTATDHTLHGRGVMSAGRPDTAGKMLNKTLDRRHETLIKRFSKMKMTDEVRKLWRECFEQGDIPGAYWAALTHPATDRALVQEVFGEVHMLSHLVGSASRLDIARLQRLQREADESAEKLVKQEARLHAAAAERNRLQQRIAMLEEALVRAQASQMVAPDDATSGIADAALRNRLDAETARADALASRLAETESRLQEAEQRKSAAINRSNALQQEVDTLEASLLGDDEAKARIKDPAASRNASVLYVGGRRNLFDRLRTLADNRGVDLLVHDGGVEDSNSQLPALVGQADVALFPIDCVSHSAALMVKRLCRETGKNFVPLRSASLASFLASLDRFEVSADA